MKMKNRMEMKTETGNELEMKTGNELAPIEFKAISNDNKNIEIAGVTCLADIDNDERPLQFYDNLNQLQWNIPKNPFNIDDEDWGTYERLKIAFQTDDLLLQYLADFATENKIVNRGEYTLVINEEI